MLENHGHFLPGVPQPGSIQVQQVFSVENDLAFLRTLQQVHAPDQRGFACAGKSDDAEDLSFRDVQRDVLDCVHIAVPGLKGLCDMFQSDHVVPPCLFK